MTSLKEEVLKLVPDYNMLSLTILHIAVTGQVGKLFICFWEYLQRQLRMELSPIFPFLSQEVYVDLAIGTGYLIAQVIGEDIKTYGEFQQRLNEIAKIANATAKPGQG